MEAASFSFTNGQMISVGFFALVVIFVVVGLLKGLKRGFGRQVIRFSTIVLSIIAALMFSSAITSFIETLCAGKTLGEVLIAVGLNGSVDYKVMDILSCFDAVTAERILALQQKVILIPIVFAISFVVISAVMLIIHAIFCGIFRISGEKAKSPSRFLGMLLGAAQGAVVALIFFLPIMNVAGIVADANVQIREKYAEDAEMNSVCIIYDEFVDDLYNDAVFNAAYDLVADPVCDAFATIEIDGEQINLRDTVSKLLATSEDFIKITEFNWSNPSSEECDTLNDVVTSVSHDKYIATVMSGTLRGLAIAIDNGILEIDLEEPVLGIAKTLVSIFTTLDAESFGDDIDTVLDVYNLLAREGVLASLVDGDPERITTAMSAQDESGTTVIRRIINTIQSNAHMKPMVTMLTKLSVSIMMNNVGVENGDQIYDSIKDGIAGVISIDKSLYATDEEYQNAVSDSLNNTLQENNIELAPEIVDNMAGYVVDNFSDLENVTDDEVNDTIFSYYEAYMKYINEGGENPFPGIIPDNDDVVPEGSIPEGSIPEGSIPEGSIPEGSIPEGSIPEGTD